VCWQKRGLDRGIALMSYQQSGATGLQCAGAPALAAEAAAAITLQQQHISSSPAIVRQQPRVCIAVRSSLPQFCHSQSNSCSWTACTVVTHSLSQDKPLPQYFLQDSAAQQVQRTSCRS
jgi:hypothetical protein